MKEEEISKTRLTCSYSSLVSSELIYLQKLDFSLSSQLGL